MRFTTGVVALEFGCDSVGMDFLRATALRTAADKVGSELFTIVHKPEKASELTH